MLKGFRTTLVAIVACLATEEAHALDQSSTAFIQIVGHDNNTIDVGSGVLITEDGWILTAHHVLENARINPNSPTSDEIKVSFVTQHNLKPALLFGCDPFAADFCLLYVQPGDLPPGIKPATTPRCQMLAAQDDVTVVGFSGDRSVVSGKVESDTPNALFKTKMSAPITPGMSGGPVFDGGSRLVGIAYGAAGASFFTPIQFGRLLLQAAGVDCGKT
jgi:S1-C subfamily serine protease